MALTVNELIKQLQKIKRKTGGDIPVYWADHDHSEYEWNSSVGKVLLLNQEDSGEIEYQKRLEKSRSGFESSFEIEGDYCLLRP